MLEKIRHKWIIFKAWSLQNPINLFIYVFVFSTIVYFSWQMIVNPLELIHDPWGRGGGRVWLVLEPIFSFIVTYWIWYSEKRSL